MRCRSCTPVPEEVRQAAGLLERRWVVSVLWASYEGAVRFNEFKQAVGAIPPRTLAQRLVELGEAGGARGGGGRARSRASSPTRSSPAAATTCAPARPGTGSRRFNATTTPTSRRRRSSTER